jgi:hypothetical protein
VNISMPNSNAASASKEETCPTQPSPLLRVGSLVIARHVSGVCAVGEPGVCYEEYRIGDRPGWSVVFQGGRYDGVSPEDVMLFLRLTGHIAPEVAGYLFTNVGQLVRDFQAGRFESAFAQALFFPCDSGSA